MRLVVDTVGADWLLERTSAATADGLAADVAQLIKHGDVGVGQKLPPVRELARALGVSPATVSSAWQQLRGLGLIRGGGRAGMTVCSAEATPRPRRYEAEGHYDEVALDLALAAPDPALLPDLHQALRATSRVPDLHRYQRIAITPALDAAVRASWPYSADALLAANGGYEGLMLTLHTFLQPGDHVLVEDPSTPRILDLLDSVRARVHLVPSDDEGLDVAALTALLPLRPAALLLQPTLHNPTGTSMTEARRDAVRDAIAPLPTMLVMEDDGFGELARHPGHPLAVTWPRHVYVRSYSKSHSPDLRLGVIEGPPELIDRIRAFRGYGSGWTSRVLQEALAWMLDDTKSARTVERASLAYEQRRLALHRALASEGVACGAGGGMTLWVPVPDERYAVVTMAAHGVSVASGSRFSPTGGLPHIRIATGTLREEDAPRVARLVAMAVRAPH